MTPRDLRCVKGCAVLEPMPAQDMLVCPVCHFGLTGLDLARAQNLQAQINDGVIGRTGVVVNGLWLEANT